MSVQSLRERQLQDLQDVVEQLGELGSLLLIALQGDDSEAWAALLERRDHALAALAQHAGAVRPAELEARLAALRAQDAHIRAGAEAARLRASTQMAGQRRRRQISDELRGQPDAPRFVDHRA